MQKSQDKLLMNTSYIREFAATIEKYASANISYSIVSIPKIGQNTISQIVAANYEALAQNKERARNTIFLRINLPEINNESVVELINELNSKLKEKEYVDNSKGWTSVSDGIRKLINKDIKIVLIVDDAYHLYCANSYMAKYLETLINQFYQNMIIIFMTNYEYPSSGISASSLGNIHRMMIEPKYFIKPFIQEDMDIAVARIKAEIDTTLSENEWKQLQRLSGNVIGVFRILLRHSIVSGVVPDNDEALHEIPTIKEYFQMVWNCLDEKSQVDPEVNNEYLSGTGLRNEGSWFMPSFGLFIDSIKKNHSKLDRTSIEKLLTWQELTLYNLLQKNSGEVVSRDQIAKEIWKDQWVDRYSDWAIAQLVSQLRKKASTVSDTIIKTVPNEGFTLLSGTHKTD